VAAEEPGMRPEWLDYKTVTPVSSIARSRGTMVVKGRKAKENTAFPSDQDTSPHERSWPSWSPGRVVGRVPSFRRI